MKKLLFGRTLMLFLLLCISSHLFAQPANDACANAVTLTTATCITSTVASSAAEITTTCAGVGTVRYDVWYKFTATSTSPTITLSNLGTNFHTTWDNNVKARLQLYSGTCGALTSIACGGTSLTGTQLTIGDPYLVRVYSTTTNAIPTSNAGFTICLSNPAPLVSSRMNEVFSISPLSGTNMIDDPWEIIYGPDDSLWITEAKGYKVYKMDPVSGNKITILDLSNSATGYLTASEHTSFNRQFNISTNNPQGGLAGMALHPDWTNKKYVYISYVYSYDGAAANSAGVFYSNRIVRFTYNTSTRKLQNPVIVCSNLPGSSDHNSQRMIIAPVGGTNYLFYAAGDMGAGQFGNAQRPIHAQTTNVYEGKILRFNLEPDLTAPANDQWIPSDNPFNSNPVSPSARNAVWSLGIRNNQGFAYVGGKLFGSSHGPYSDDEINVIEKEKNYGHPRVIGYAFDGNYNGSRAGHRNGNGATNHPTSMPAITNEAADSLAITNYKTPMFSAYPSTQAVINNIWTLENDGNSATGVGNGSWPSEGWSGMDAYTHTMIPGWKNSLVLGSLKWGRMLRFKIDAAAEMVLPIGGFDTLSYFGSTNRFRDIAIAPNGKDVFLVMDKSETTSGPSAANPRVSACNGCVQKYTFLGYADASGKSSIPTTIPITSGTANTCNTGTTVTIDATNNNLWVPITGPDGNIMAEIKANGNNLGTVTSSFYVKSGAVRNRGGRSYLNRSITISPTVQPSSPVAIRLYITTSEYTALDLDASSGVSSIGDIKILKNNDACLSAMVTNATLVSPVAEAFGSGYVLQANISSFSTFYFGSSSAVLPLDLITFSGSLQNNVTMLKWTTENETNSSHFVVERSVDGSNFAAIGDVKASGATTRSNYSFLDAQVLSLQSDIIYYRLKMVDRNNEFKYSNIISVTISDKNSTVNVSPNPVTNIAQVRINADASGAVKWTLVDNAGRTILSSQVQVQRNNPNTFTINMENLAQGTYYLQLSGAGMDKKVKLQKL